MRFFIIFIFLLFSKASFSQSCLTEGIHFDRQEQIDSFQVQYPGCSNIVGDVRISGSAIKYLDSLNVLSSIGGDLLI